MKNRYAVILGNLGNTCDRFLPTGYKEKVSKEEMIRQAVAIPGIEGVELVGTWDITKENRKTVAGLLKSAGLACVSIIPDLFSQARWGGGSFAAKDAAIRRQALDESRAAAEMAGQLNCPLVNLWLGQDGFDYPLQSDYRRERAWLAEGLHALASEFPKLRFALEYKPKEPRTHSFLARAGDTLGMAERIGLKNVGVCIDVGHGLMAGENVSESAVQLAESGRLFHMHFNDNYRTWDDDMIVGSLHLTEYVELLFWLKELEYDGWLSMDQYPYREDGAEAIRESVAFLRSIESRLTAARCRELRALIEAGKATGSCAWMREFVFGKSPTNASGKKRLRDTERGR